MIQERVDACQGLGGETSSCMRYLLVQVCPDLRENDLRDVVGRVLRDDICKPNPAISSIEGVLHICHEATEGESTWIRKVAHPPVLPLRQRLPWYSEASHEGYLRRKRGKHPGNSCWLTGGTAVDSSGH